MQSGDERVVWRRKARLSLPTGVVRGTLRVTGDRLIHLPSAFTRKRNRVTREWPLASVKSVLGANPRDRTFFRDTTPYAGSVRKRLHVRMDDGQELLFLVEERDQAVRELQGLTTEHAAQSGVRQSQEPHLPFEHGRAG